MSHYNTILNQLLTQIPRHQFQGLVNEVFGDRLVRKMSTWNQFTVLLYAQASGKNSLRDIENSLLAQGSKSYHLGLPERVCKSTLADANGQRDSRVYERMFYALLERCQTLTPKHRFRFKNPLYSLDATVIDVALSLFPWARFRTAKGALKLHCQLDHSGHIPTFLVMTEGREADIRGNRGHS